MKTTVFAIVSNELAARVAIEQLQVSNFTEENFSVLYPASTPGAQPVTAANSTKAPEGAVAGASTLGVIGGVAGLLAGLGTLAIPGVGPLIAAGPILAALSGLGVGAAVGGIGGALVGLGIPEYEANVYTNKIKQGNVLIAVHSLDKAEVDHVRQIFTDLGAHDISTATTPNTK